MRSITSGREYGGNPVLRRFVPGHVPPPLHLSPLDAVDLPLELLLGKAPKMQRNVEHVEVIQPPLDISYIDICEAIYRVLKLPAVADKTFRKTGISPHRGHP